MHIMLKVIIDVVLIDVVGIIQKLLDQHVEPSNLRVFIASHLSILYNNSLVRQDHVAVTYHCVIFHFFYLYKFVLYHNYMNNDLLL